MARKRTTTTEHYSSLAISVDGFSADIDASINYEARSTRRHDSKVRIFQFSSGLDLEGVCTYPEDRANERYHVAVNGQQPGAGSLDDTLAKYHIRDESGTLKYRKVRGKQLPVYKIPSGLGLLEKKRGTKTWIGWIWVPEQTVTQMLILATTVRPLYMHIHERNIDRKRWINGFTLQTTDPAEE